jgi:hypothetical protein
MKSLFKFYFVAFTLAAVFTVGSVKADDPGNPNDILGGGGSGVTAEGVPIDGGVSLLAISGGAFALRRLRNKKAAKAAALKA